MSVVVTGANGHLGRLVVQSLLDQGTPAADVVAAARDPKKLADLAEQGVRTKQLDYDNSDTISFDQGDVVLLISGSVPGNRVAQHQAVIDAAVRDGVSRLVYTSAPKADNTPLILAPEHAATEAAIHASGLPHTILRNNWYTENYAQQLQQASATGVLLDSAGSGRVASASRADFAQAAAVVLTGDGHEGATYELGGDTAWTFDELADAFAQVTGREVTRQQVDTAAHVAALKGAGLDDGTAGFVAGLDANIADGALAQSTGDLSRLIGRPTTPLVEGLRPLL